jgi:hypothetical protein
MIWVEPAVALVLLVAQQEHQAVLAMLCLALAAVVAATLAVPAAAAAVDMAAAGLPDAVAVAVALATGMQKVGNRLLVLCRPLARTKPAPMPVTAL